MERSTVQGRTAEALHRVGLTCDIKGRGDSVTQHPRQPPVYLGDAAVLLLSLAQLRQLRHRSVEPPGHAGYTHVSDPSREG